MTPQKFREFAEKRQKSSQNFSAAICRGSWEQRRCSISGAISPGVAFWMITYRRGRRHGASRPSPEPTGSAVPLLSRTNTLRNRILFKPAPGRVRIYNDLIYAAIHNNGGNITITPILRNTKALKQKRPQRKATTFSIISAALLERHAP